MLAPICPFITEKIFLSLHEGVSQTSSKTFSKNKQPLSIHLQPFPTADPKKIHPKLESQMAVIQQLSETLNAARAAAKIKLRWPLTSADIATTPEKKQSLKSALQSLRTVLENITNIQSISVVDRVTGQSFQSGDIKILLGQPLMDEALIRELVRQIQELRKQANLKVDESILLYLKTDPTTQRLLESRKADLLAGVNASTLSFTLPNKKGALEFDGRRVEIGFERKAR